MEKRLQTVSKLLKNGICSDIECTTVGTPCMQVRYCRSMWLLTMITQVRRAGRSRSFSELIFQKARGEHRSRRCHLPSIGPLIKTLRKTTRACVLSYIGYFTRQTDYFTTCYSINSNLVNLLTKSIIL